MGLLVIRSGLLSYIDKVCLKDTFTYVMSFVGESDSFDDFDFYGRTSTQTSPTRKVFHEVQDLKCFFYHSK